MDEWKQENFNGDWRFQDNGLEDEYRQYCKDQEIKDEQYQADLKVYLAAKDDIKKKALK